jgi:hypothetical protein
MKNLLLALTASMFAISALAQEGTATTTEVKADSKVVDATKKKAKKKKSKAKKSTKADAAESTPVAAAAVSAAPVTLDRAPAAKEVSAAAQTSTTTLDAAKPAESKAKMTMDITAVMDVAATNSIANGQKDFLSYVAPGYKFDELNSIAVRNYFSYTKLGEGQAGVQENAKLLNPMFIFSRNVKVMGSDPSAIQLRVVTPNNDGSKFDIANISVLSDIIWTLNSKIQIEYTLKPGVKFSSNSARNVNTLTANNIIGYYNFNDKVAAYQNVGLVSDDLSGEGNTYLEGGIQVSPLKNMVLIGNIQQKHMHASAAKAFSLYDTDESAYELLMQVVF